MQDWTLQENSSGGAAINLVGTSHAQLTKAEAGVNHVYTQFNMPTQTFASNTAFLPVPAFLTPPSGAGGLGTEMEQYYFHPDHLGSSNYITNIAGEVSQHTEYFAFGETFVEEHKGSNNSPYKFNGKELDEESGLYYYGARYYDPRISIWASVDPLTEKFPNESPYIYCSNSPVVYNDPTGMEKELPDREKLGKGDWHKSDRVNSTKVWQDANKHNLTQKNGNLEYNTISERTAFYKWFQLETEDKGFDTKWAGGAYVIAHQMEATDGLGKDLGFVSKEMIKFANDGNKAIFDDVFDDLGKLYAGGVKKGQDAKKWDMKTLENEQKNVVGPIYNRQTSEVKKQLNDLAKHKGFPSSMQPSYMKFKGNNLLDWRQRFDHGMNVAIPHWNRISPFYHTQRNRNKK